MIPEITSQSSFIEIRGLRYHVRTWGDPALPKLFLLHGWLDNSASFQFLAELLSTRWHLIAPDWRGSGQSQWSTGGGYYFSDMLADLDHIISHFVPSGAVTLIGHSFGFNISGIYSGVRPQRVARLINCECYGFRKVDPEDVIPRYADWLKVQATDRRPRTYANFAEFESQLLKTNPRLPAERAAFLARHLAAEQENGTVSLTNDPAQGSAAGRLLYVGHLRRDEAMACWRAITAPTLWIRAEKSWVPRTIGTYTEEIGAMRSCFRDIRETVIPDAGHIVHVEQPELVADAINAFLSSTPDPR